MHFDPVDFKHIYVALRKEVRGVYEYISTQLYYIESSHLSLSADVLM